MQNKFSKGTFIYLKTSKELASKSISKAYKLQNNMVLSICGFEYSIHA